jgi:hypothetical protein
MFTYSLNNKEYEFEISLIKRDFGVLELSLSNVLNVTIINDSYEPFPRMTITIKDPNGSTIPYFKADNNSYIVFTVIANVLQGDTTNRIEKSHLFNIERVKPINFTGESNTYEISASSEYLRQWFNPISFSTESNNISVTVSAANILNKANIPFARPIKESSRRMFYCTDINTPVRDHVQRLLDFASLGGDGFYYTWYDMFENKLYIDSTKNLITNGKYNAYNIISIPSADFGANDIHSAKSIHHTNDVSASEINLISKGIKEFKFNFTKGQFDQHKMEYVDIKNGSTISQLAPVIGRNINIDSDVNYTQKATGHTWYKDIRSAIRNYTSVSLVMEGAIQRNIGDLVLMKSSESLQQTFGGVWMTMRTIDTFNFGAEKYDQTIVVSKVGGA